MPGIPQAIADELLPLLFRRQRGLPRTPPFAGGSSPLEDPPNVLAKRRYFNEEGEGVPLGNMLAPSQDPAPPTMVAQGAVPSNYALPDETRPRKVTQPGITSPGIGSEGMPRPVAAAPMMQSPEMDAGASRARRVETDKRGRPTPNIALQGDEQALDYQDRLARMPEDTAGGGWWPKIRAAIGGFAAGGPVGAATAFGTRALREHFDPTLGSREYKRDKMAQNAPAVEQIRQSRKDRLDEESKVANTDLAKARTDALRNPRQNARIIGRKDGVYMLNTKTGKFERVEEIPAETGAPNSARYFKAGNGEVWKIDAANPEGVRVRNIPGAPGKDSEDVGFHNTQIQRSISEAQAEQKKIDDNLPGIPMTIEATDILTGTRKMISNPEYTYNMTRRRQLDDQIRRWRTQLKSPKKGAAGSTKESDPLGILDEEDKEP